MSGPRGDEFAPGSQYYVRPEGQVEDPFPAKLAEHFRQWAPPPNSAAGAEWGNWQPTPASAGERPAPLIRIGVVEGLDSGPPPPICLGGLGERHTVISDSKKAEEASRQMLLRILGSAGNVRAVICDTARTGAFRDFLEPGLCENIFPDDVDGVLKDLVQLQHKVATESEVQIGSAAEPWRILVITGNPRSATARDHLSLLTQSTNWGSIIALGTDIQDNELIQRGPPRGLKWRLDPQLPSSLVRQAVKDMAARAQPKSLSMIELIEASHQRMPSGKGLEGCVGTKRDGSIVRICFADETPHGLIVGRTGSGKTNFLTYMMSDLLHAYSPDDIQMYVVDGKKADLSVLGPGEGDETYFPQMRLLGSNVTDPEDGIAILRHIEKEMERRYLSMNDKRVKDIEGLRSRLPGEKWPRMLVVWDEVQELLDGPLSDAAVNIINKLARQGRQAGVHLMLGTQNWQGVEGIWKKPDMLKQFALRIALAGGEGMMDNQTNWSIMGEVTGHLAAINKKGGMRHTDADNEIVSTPEVTNHDFVAIKLRTFQRWSVNQPPEVLDGRIKPVLGTSQAFMELKPSAQKPAVGFVGQMPGIGGRAAEFKFEPSPGRNLAVLGKPKGEIYQILGSMVKSIGRQHSPAEAAISILHYGDSDDAATATELASHLEINGHTTGLYAGEAADDFLTEIASQPNDQPHYVFVFGADRVRSTSFKDIISEGPENQTYVIGSWTGLERLKSVTGTYISDVTDRFNGIVLLNVTPSDLKAVSASPSHRTWGGGERPGRALFFDMIGNTGEDGLVVKLYT